MSTRCYDRYRLALWSNGTDRRPRSRAGSPKVDPPRCPMKVDISVFWELLRLDKITNPATGIHYETVTVCPIVVEFPRFARQINCHQALHLYDIVISLHRRETEGAKETSILSMSGSGESRKLPPLRVRQVLGIRKLKVVEVKIAFPLCQADAENS